jgi:polyhydroxybutyrate depolymerase
MRNLLAVLVAVAAACGDDGGAVAEDAGAGEGDAGGDGGPPVPMYVVVGPAGRTARLVLPRAYDGTTAFPLVVLLHGYSTTSGAQDLYWGLSRLARREGFYLLLPDGTVDSMGNQFWNATDSCCDFDGTGIDDVAYLDGLLDEVVASRPVDEARVYFAGHSNGGYMSYRMACERAGRIAAIASLAGSSFVDEMDCHASEPVSVLQIHGDMDDTVAYDGDASAPGAEELVTRWATRAGCDTTMPETLAPFDLDTTVDGDETLVTRYGAGCAAGLDAELWRIAGGGHIPIVAEDFATRLSQWLLRHAK